MQLIYNRTENENVGGQRADGINRKQIANDRLKPNSINQKCLKKVV